jgi:hypothetical protein
MSSTLDFPLQFRRQYAGPLDADAVFATSQARTDFLNNPLCYPGMMVFDLEANRPFWVNTDKSAYVGAATSGDTLNMVVHSDIDNYSAQVLMVGPISSISVDLANEILAVSFEVRLDTADTWTAQSDIAALQAWINTSVTAATKWQIRLLATYATGKYGEASIRLSFS